MYISPINNSPNINSKAKLSLIAEKNLLPKNAIKQLIEKAEKIGNSGDVIHIGIINDKNYSETHIRMLYSHIKKDLFSDFKYNIVIGSHKERQNKTFNFINDYLDNLKKEYEK